MKKTILVSLTTASLLLGSGHEAHDNHVPVINFIADFSYVDRSQELHEVEAPGFFHAHEEGHTHAHSHNETHSKNGFNFNNAELEIEAAIGKDFEVFSTFHLAEDSFEVEELYGKTLNKDGFNVKAGKFLSSFGINNSKHPESWDFAQQPIINNFLFGDHGLNEKGIGLSWNNRDLKVGFEVLNGENERSFGTSKIEYTTNGGFEIKEATKPELYVAYLKHNQRFGTTVINTGLSFADGTTRIDHTDDDTPHAVETDTKIYGADLTLKFPFTRISDITVTTEYMRREMDGTKYKDNGLIIQNLVETRDQSGFYTSAIYTIDPKWKTGIQFNKITKNEIITNTINQNITSDFKKTSFMVEHNYNENNKFRLQYNKDKSKYTDASGQLSYNEVIFQWVFTFGTGEHKH